MKGIIPYIRKFRLAKLGKYWLVATLMALLTSVALACSPEVGRPSADAVYDFPITFYQGKDAVGVETASLSELRGQPVVLNLWAGLCPPCRAEMPEFQRFADEYSGRALVIGVDLGQFFSLGNQDDAIKLLDELAVDYPAGFTDDANVVRELTVLALPATYFINADGSLHRQWQGILDGAKLAEITDEMLAQ